tara:strand:- start:1260 stop:1889 length:630 start_codon:yes stop_codon:yes gene_type:complete
LLNPRPTKFYKYVPAPVYKEEDYLKTLKKNNEEMGIPYKDPQLPKYEIVVKPEPKKEPELTFSDRIYVKMKILKSGIVRIKMDASIASLHEKYYKKALRPPMKSILSAYKSMGFSPQFLEKIKNRFAWKVKEQKRIEKVVDKIFNKEPAKKVKKKKKEEEEIVEEIVEEPPEDEEEKDHAPEEDEGLDIEPDADEDVEEPVDEEEYLSD